MEQINSFRAGHDVGMMMEQNKDKLEIHTLSDDSNSNGPSQNVTPQSNNGNGIKEENTAGENIKPSKIPSRSRSSADTVIVETCYETAEDIQKDLESGNVEKENGGTKSLRDCITYSEPLTPMLQEVLDDFQSEPENETEMEITHTEPTENSENIENIQEEVLKLITENENEKSNPQENSQPKTATEAGSDKVAQKQVEDKYPKDDKPGEKPQESAIDADNDSEIVCLDSPIPDDNEVANNVEEEIQGNTRNGADKTTDMDVVNDTENTAKIEEHNSKENSEDIPLSAGLPNTISSTDTTLPNNPEALKKRISNETQEDKSTEAKPSEAKPSEVKPSVAKPTEVKPSVAEPPVVKLPEVKPSVAKPSVAKPSVAKPSVVKPPVAKASVAKPLEVKPSVAKPSEVKPSEVKPLVGKPSVVKQPVAKPSEDKLSEKKDENQLSRKRSNSESIKVVENKKTKMETNKNIATSETLVRKGGKPDDSPGKVRTGNIDSPSKLKAGNFQPTKGSSKPNGIPVSKNVTNSNKVAPNLAKTSEKPSTSLANDDSQVILTSDSEKGENVNESSEIKNPCLENLSLFEGQLNKNKYTMSESSDMEQKKKNEVNEEKKKPEKEKDMVKLNTHSESESQDPTPPKKKHRAGVATSKKDRERALSNVFGFASGTSQSKRRMQLSRRRRTVSQQNNVSHNNGGSDSSEWTSESDSDMYVLPPRGRKNRQTRKYLKPQSGRIFSLGEEGGLFVMYGKKIYPLVKDGKLVKNYLHYLPDSDSEEEKNYWKSKYVEEKKKAEELKKLLEEAKEPQACDAPSTSVQSNPPRTRASNQNQPEVVSNPGKQICVQDEKTEAPKPAPPENIKIKFTTKNDQEIQLEGNWPQIHNVLEHVVQIFHKEPQPVSQYKPKAVVEPPSSSGISTPVIITAVHDNVIDPEVHEKVNKIESEIFKEIEERDKEEQKQEQPSTNEQESNVTKRKAGRPRKSSQSSAPQSPAKRQKISAPQDSEVNSTNNKAPADTETNVANEGTKKQRTSRTNVNESPDSNATNTMQTRRSKLKLDTSVGNEDDVRYKLPPRNKRQSIKATTDKNTRDKPQKR